MEEKLRHLIIKIASGDQEAFRSIFNNFSGKVFAFSFKLTRSHSLSQEIVQEVFTKIWVHRERLTNVDHFPSYLYTICRNIAFNILKRMAIEEKAKLIIQRRQTVIDSNTEHGIVLRDYERILVKVVNRLPPQQRLVFGLCHGEGLKYEEAAQRLNISRLTVKSHMQQALRTIKSHFGGLLSSLVLCCL